MLAAITAFALQAQGPLGLPPQATEHARNVDALYHFLVYLSVFFLVIIVGGALLFAWRYRRRPDGPPPSPRKGHVPLEVAWTAIPTLLLGVIFWWGFDTYLQGAVPPADTFDVRVVARTWAWTFEYPEHGIVSGELVVPEDRPIRLVNLSSEDVIHSFFVPDYRIKNDVIPNRYSILWFEAEEPGVHQVFCTEFCGTGHATMGTVVRVLPETEFEDWLLSGGGLGDDVPLVARGEKLFSVHGCNACHALDGTAKIGPSPAGIYDTARGLADGTLVTADENYLRESIVAPQSKLVEGYPPVMPTYAGRLSDRELDALVEYLKSLS